MAINPIKPTEHAEKNISPKIRKSPKSTAFEFLNWP